MSENAFWLRNMLQLELMPLGNTGNQLANAGEGFSNSHYRTDKPHSFPRSALPGLGAIIDSCERREWLVFCYSPLPYYSGRAAFFRQVYTTASARLAKPLAEKQAKKFGSLVLLAALAARADLTDATQIISGTQLASLLKVKPQTYRALWATRFKLLIDTFKAYDQEAINLVSWEILNQKKRA